MVDLNRNEELREAIELMYFAYRKFTTGPDRILARHGLTRVHHRILYFVGRQPGLSVKELLEVLQTSKQALNSPLRQLIVMRLVDSEKSPHDGRVRELRLTADGRQLEKRITATQLRLLESVFESSSSTAEPGWREIMKVLA